MGGKVLAIILLVVGLGIALYLFNSGVIAKFGSAITPPGGTSTSTVAAATTSTTSPSSSSSGNSFFSFLSRLFHPVTVIGPGSAGVGTTSGGQSSGGSGSALSPASPLAPSTSSIPASQIPKGFTLAQLSPYFHMVRFSGVGISQIGLSAPGTTAATTTIDITGWKIQTNRSGEYIPQAVNIYDPSAAAVLSDIILTIRQNDIVYFYSNSSPVNLRLNKCMGFLNATHQFNPALPSSCPAVDRSAIANFTGQCQNYILSLGCQPVNMASPQIPRFDYACQQYLENNFTYKSCVSIHGVDKDFLSNQWRVWMGSSPLDRYHDNVELLDKQGLVVDTYSY